MIKRFDDYCVHQTAQPVAEPSQSDRNFYDRYWFNGFDDSGSYVFEVGLGLYPNRHVMDGHFSVAMGDRQVAFHGSRRAPVERSDTSVGQLSVTVEQPLRVLRVVLAENEHGIECDLRFCAASAPHREPPSVLYDDGHLIMHTTRFTQFGYWYGWFSIDGRRYDVSRAYGTRDRSWGVRPVGEPQGGAPGLLNRKPGVYWIWCPINWGGFCTHMGTFEDAQGKPTQVSADRLPLYDSPEAIPDGDPQDAVAMTSVEHQLTYHPGTRFPAEARMAFRGVDGEAYTFTLTPLQRFQTLGVGYNHPQWGHGVWRGELEMAREEWHLEEIDPLAPEFIHVHQVVRAERNGRVGMGILESLILGPHERSGLRGLFDGAV